MTAHELADVTKLDVKKAEKAIKTVDANKDKVLSRPEFHDFMNRNRIRNPSVARGEKAFKTLDKNGVSLISRKVNFIH